MAITCESTIIQIMTRYRTLLYQVQAYSNTKLSAKGVYTTLLSFCFSVTGAMIYQTSFHPIYNVTAMNYCYIGRITSMVLSCLISSEQKDSQPEDTVTLLLNRILEGKRETGGARSFIF